MPQKTIPTERLMGLHESLMLSQPYSNERRREILKVAEEYHIAEYTVRRQYNQWLNISLKGRSDKGSSRIAPKGEIEKWVIMVAAVQLATLNKKGHMCSTRRAIEILETGVAFDDDGDKNKTFCLPKAKLSVPTANRWLRMLRIRDGKKFRIIVPIHFRAEVSNQLWQVDTSPSDAKYFGDRKRSDGKTPQFYAVTDDHSGVVYAAYRETRDEDVQAGLEVLYEAMAPKKDASFPFQGIPNCFYFDPGRMGRSPLIKKILEDRLGGKVRVHQSDSMTGKLKKASRAKGKIERSFQTLKSDFESLFHFHRPRNVAEANEWLFKYLLTFNSRPHPEPGVDGSRMQVWINGLPDSGYRQICDEDTFWTYVSEPESHVVGPDARIIMGNKSVYVVSPDLAGERVEIWYAADNQGLFVKDVYGKVHGPYPVALRPVPAGDFKQHKKTERDRMVEKIMAISGSITIPQEAIYADRRTSEQKDVIYQLRYTPFTGPEPFIEKDFASIRDFYQRFFDWFKKPVGTLPQKVQHDLEEAFEETRNPDKLWRLSQAILRNHHLMR